MAAVVSVSPPRRRRAQAIARSLASRRTCRTLATVVRASSVGSAVVGGQSPTGGSPGGLEGGGTESVLPRRVFGFTEAGGYHGVDRMLLDGPGGHLGDHTGADDRLGSAMGGPRERTGQPSAVRRGGDRGCPAERQRPHGRADAAALGGVQLAGRQKRRTAARVVGPAPRILGRALASRPERLARRPAPWPPGTRRPAASCAVSSEVAPRAVNALVKGLQRLPTHLLWRASSQGAPAPSPAA